mgnify:CR=1 FL=1
MSLPDIKLLYRQYNAQHFGNSLPDDLPVIWNSRLRTTAGQCHYVRKGRFGDIKPKKITLNPRLIGDDLKKIENTLIHEMVHAWLAHTTGETHRHDSYFQSKMDQIVGYKRSHTYHRYDTADLREKRLVECRCPVHGVVGRRARMPIGYNVSRYKCPQCRAQIEFVDTRPVKQSKPRLKRAATPGKLKIKINI